jgi:hypothetical protein
MSQWLNELQEIGFELFGRESAGEMWGLVAVCVFALFFLYGKLSQGFKGGGDRSFLVIIPAVLVAALAMAAVRIYWSSSWGFMLAAALIAFLVIILPLTAAVEKTSYVSALLVWLVCALTLTFILVLEKPVVDSFQRGVKKGSLIKKQQDFYKELEKK